MARGTFIQRRLAKPHFLLRPDQAARRFRQAARRAPLPPECTSTLPWGLPISFDPAEAIGSSIHRTGVFELAVTETLLRLADPGELALDVGGNIGYMSSVLAAAVGPEGSVLTFEPHPLVVRRLRANASRWPVVEVRELALSDHGGSGHLVEPGAFGTNQGTATLAEVGGGHEVRLATLDELELDRPVGVMKIDVEGNELAVLRGATGMLERRAIREIVFEEHLPPPTPTTAHLLDAGYTLLAVFERVRGLGVGMVEELRDWRGWDAPTYVASCEPERTRRRLQARGWRSLRPR
jgi:FkbM family methyltransferase